MTSSSRQKKTRAPEKQEKTEVEQPKEPYVPRQGVFEFVVIAFTGPLPGSKSYDEKKDHLLSGFQFGGSTVPGWMPSSVLSIKDITAYDFLTDPKTGLRQGQKEPPKGAQVTGMDNGLSSWQDIVPLWIWNKGQWLSDLLKEGTGFDINDLPEYFRTKCREALKKADGKGIPADLFPYWVTSGEGSTGNYLYRVYKLPDEIAGNTYPKHPVLWPKHIKRGTYSSSSSGGLYSGGSSYSSSSSSKSSDSGLPIGVRIRCGGCGHWFKTSDLPGHAQVCGKGDEADWAMMCADECGCKTLDEASIPKPGFPRPSVAKKEEEKKEPSATKKAADEREEKEADERDLQSIT